MIQTFEDDAGDDLMIGTPHWEWYRNAEISKSGRVCTMDLIATNLPREGARRVRVSGILTFISASGREKAREVIAVREDVIGFVGDLQYEVRNVHPDIGSPTKTVQIMYYGVKRELSPINEIKYFYEDGTPMEADEVRFHYSKKGLVIHVRLPRQATAFQVEVDQWLDYEIIEVPYELDEAI